MRPTRGRPLRDLDTGARQTVTAALQTSPDALVARATMRSRPAGLRRRRSTENEPLGAFVRARVLTTDLPSRRMRTDHLTPLRFWSTSNSVSSRPLRGLTLSFADERAVQVPAARLALLPTAR